MMKQPSPIYIAAATGVSEPAFWAQPIPSEDGSEPLILLRLCSFIRLLYGAHLFEVAELTCTIVEVTKTQLYIMKEGQFRAIFPETEPEGKVAYHDLFFSYSEMILVMLQMHYFHLSTKIHANENGTQRKLLMTREQVITQAARKFSFDSIFTLLYKLDQFEQQTTQLLHHISPPNDKLKDSLSFDTRRKYVDTSCHLGTVLTQNQMLFMNMSVIRVGTPIPLAITFLAASVEGYYVYHAHPEKRLSQISVQMEASKRWIALQPNAVKKNRKKKITVAKPIAPVTPEITVAEPTVPVTPVITVTKPELIAPVTPVITVAKPITPFTPEITVAKPITPVTPVITVAKPIAPVTPVITVAEPTAPITPKTKETGKKKKRVKDVEVIKALQRTKAAEALERAKAAEAKEKAEIKAAATKAVEIIEARMRNEVVQPVVTYEYLNGEPHLWCTWNDCLCHMLRGQFI